MRVDDVASDIRRALPTSWSCLEESREIRPGRYTYISQYRSPRHRMLCNSGKEG